MNPWQRVAMGLGVLAFAILLTFRPYDVCGAAICSVVYSYVGHPPIIDPADGGGADDGLLAAQLLLIVLTVAAAILLLASPVRLWRVVGLVTSLVILILLLAVANVFPMFAFDAAMFGNGITGIILAAVALGKRQHNGATRNIP